MTSVSEPGKTFPAPTVPEPLLAYDPQTNQWSGANASFSVWMDDATFRAYAAVWCEYTHWLPQLPPAERFTAALAHCQRLVYWNGCERNYDHRIRITYR